MRTMDIEYPNRHLIQVLVPDDVIDYVQCARIHLYFCLILCRSPRETAF